MTSARETAIEVLAEALGMESTEIGDDTTLGVTRQWDSLAHLRLMLSLEEHLSHRLDPETIVSIATLDDVIRLFDAR